MATLFKYLVSFDRKLFQISANNATKLKLLFSYYWFPLRKKLQLKLFPTLRLKLKFEKRTFYCSIGDVLDHIVLRENFIDRVYKVNNLRSASPVILDLGAHIGTASIYFKLKYPQARIFAFEPSPDLFPLLVSNTSQFAEIKCLPYAIGASDKKRQFFIHPTSGLSSSFFPRKVGGTRVLIIARSLYSLLQEFNLSRIDLIKFDIEGAEGEVFANFSKIKSVEALIGEVHLKLMTKNLEEFLELFPSYKKKVLYLGKSKRLVIFQK